MSRTQEGVRRRDVAAAHADDYGGVLSRRLLRELRIDRHGIRSEVRAGRWVLHGHQTVAIHNGPLSDLARRWRAIWEVGHLIAALDGASALCAGGLKGYEPDDVEVSIPHGSRPYAVHGVTTRTVVERLPDEVIRAGVPRVRPAVSALRGATWARTDRQAALLLCLVVQQRQATAVQLREKLEVLRLPRRRAFLSRIVSDLADGAQALGELDFAQMCRERGLPAPSRQAVRHGPGGRIYLDVVWEEVGLVVEIDGSHHRMGLAVSEDNLRQNAIVLGNEKVLRIDLVGLRLRSSEFMDQVCAAYGQLALKAAG